MSSNKKEEIIELLQKAYCMEMETVANYLANSIHLDGISAEQVKQSLGEDIQEELEHATKLGNRIKQLGGCIPGSFALAYDQKNMQPPEDPTDVVSIVKGVVEAETKAVEHYKKVIDTARDEDPVTEDLAITLSADEMEHRTQFEGFLAEYRKEPAGA